MVAAGYMTGAPAAHNEFGGVVENHIEIAADIVLRMKVVAVDLLVRTLD
jgi:hypothetical protein